MPLGLRLLKEMNGKGAWLAEKGDEGENRKSMVELIDAQIKRLTNLSRFSNRCSLSFWLQCGVNRFLSVFSDLRGIYIFLDTGLLIATLANRKRTRKCRSTAVFADWVHTFNEELFDILRRREVNLKSQR